MPDNSLDFLPLKLNLFKDKYLFKPLTTSGHQIHKIISKKQEIIVTKEIPKRDSKEIRIIQYPVGSYKLILRRLHKLLMRRSKFPQSVCGGIIDKNLFHMVSSHCGQEAIYQVDLKDFFPKISSDRIYSFFLSSNCSAHIAEILTELVSFENKLPQGFPTSPIIANLIAWKMDFDHENICSGHKLIRTRWIDDILISGRIKDLDPEIHKIEKSIIKNGFTINSKKKKYIRRVDRKKEMIAVGLDIRKHKPDVPQIIFNKIESMLIIFKEEGATKLIELFEEEFIGKDIRQSLAGKIRFIAQYNQQKGLYLMDLFEQASVVSKDL